MLFFAVAPAFAFLILPLIVEGWLDRRMQRELAADRVRTEA